MSDTFPDETLYPVLTSLADNDRLFASNSAAGHESSQIKGSTIKGLINSCRPKHAYVAITTASTAIAAERGNTYGVNANGCTLTLPVAGAGYVDGDEICVVVGVTAARELAIVSPSYILRGSGVHPLNLPFNVTGFGTFISFTKCSNMWVMSYPEYELGLKAPLASPALTGTPTAPTAAVGTNTTQLATTAFCAAALAGKANDADVVKLTGNQSIGGTKTFTTSPVLPTPTAGDNTTKGATTAFVTGALAGKANDADVVKLTGNQSIGGTKTFTTSPVLPTPTAGDNTTKGATTAFVTGELAGKANDADVVKLAGNQSIGGTKTFTASPLMPTPSAGDNTTKGATTAFVAGAVAACRPKHPYVPITTASTAIAAERGNTYGVNANGCTLTLPAANVAGYVDGDEICVVVGVSAARELAIVSPSYISRGTGLQPLNTLFNVTGFGTFISFTKCSNTWAMSYPEYELSLKAPLASPALTGTPTAPTAAVGTNTTQLATTAFCAAGFLPRFEAVVERTAATTAEPNKLYVNVKDDSAENTLMLTLPSPTGNAGKVIGLTSRYRRSSYTNEEANWKLTGHIDGIASNTYWQGYWELGSALLWCDGTTWHMLTDWRAEQEW